MKVLQLHTRYRAPGGEDVVVAQDAAALRAAGHHVSSFAMENPQGAAATAGSLALSPWNPRSARALRKQIRADRPDVAHVHNTWFAMSHSVLDELRRAEIPVVLTLHNFRFACAAATLFRDGHVCSDCVGRSALPAVRHRCYRGSRVASAAAAAAITLTNRRDVWTSAVDVLLAPSQVVADHAVAAGLPADRTRVKPNTVPAAPPREVAAAASRTVLFVGRLTPEKGLGVVLDAWRGLTGSKGAPPQLVVAGDGPSRAEWAGRGVAGVTFLGQQSASSVRDLMGRARLLVFPSTWPEPFGLVAAEAFAAGLPVLASRIGALPDIVGPLGPAWLARPGDIADWTRTLDLLLADDGQVRTGSEDALRAYADRFAPDAGLASLVQAYTDASVRHAQRRATS